MTLARIAPRVLAGYARALAWLAEGSEGPEHAFDPEAWAGLEADVARFLAAVGATGTPAIVAVRARPEEAGHDLALTCRGEGAGFWDGDWPEPVGSRLAAIARRMGPVDAYVGDDGRLHVSYG